MTRPFLNCYAFNFQLFLACVLTSSHGRPQNGYNYNAPSVRDGNLFGSQSINYYQHLNSNANQFRIQQPPFANNFIDNNVQNTDGGLFGSNLNSIGGVNSFAVRPTLVHKHIYVHVPPPEPEDEIPAQSQLAPAVIPQKHYKIIFIKAPSMAPSPLQQQQQQIALASQNQEKTIVYVLVKKPVEESNSLAASTPIGAISAPASKPEVYFIKYKTQKEDRDGFGVNTASSDHFNSVSNGISSGLFNTVVPLQGSSSVSTGGAIESAGKFRIPFLDIKFIESKWLS